MGASKSRIVIWAASLFLGFNLFTLLISWLLTVTFEIMWIWETARPWEFPSALFAIPFATLVASYFSVRRLNHHILPSLWLYTIIVVAIGLVSVSVERSIDSVSNFVWWAPPILFASFIVLVWFARRISVESFRHSVLFVVLTMAAPTSASLIPAQLQYADPLIGQPLPIYLTIWAGGAVMGVLAVWALANTRTVVSTTRTLLPPVTAMSLLTAVLAGLSAVDLNEPGGVLDWVAPMLTAGISSLILPTLAVVVTFAFRVRGPTVETA